MLGLVIGPKGSSNSTDGQAGARKEEGKERNGPMRAKQSLICVVLLGLDAGLARGESVTLVDRGIARCCVVVGLDADFREPAQANWAPKATLLKWAA